MRLSSSEIARMIDISAVQARHGRAEIEELVTAAIEYGFGSVHVLPCWVAETAQLLSKQQGIVLGAPVGFPSGGHTSEIKVAEARRIVADGAGEMDVMINLGKLLSGDYEYVIRDLKSVVDAAGEVPVKVILETSYLEKGQILKACDCSIEAGAQYVKTSIGWAGGATFGCAVYRSYSPSSPVNSSTISSNIVFCSSVV